ncbi:hypothetical protein MML48_1g18696 [Holotrichia oblita]|uniref:Uncharacterized protein n=1 Tax=Holotrichia oblita TaxID=644536 RepID=A0ACB9TTZ2_HOLOL|nr:hypothetical protein MML48_1g18696 [Holotrichia oblita]
MELVNEFVNNQFALYIPVALVLVGAILVFAFGFKSAEQPPFDKLSSIDSEERKTLGKKKKLKEKKTSANGSVPNVTEKVDKSPSKESKKKEQDNAKKTDNKPKPTVEKRKSDPVKLIEEKNKKNAKTKITEKPADFDDGKSSGNFESAAKEPEPKEIEAAEIKIEPVEIKKEKKVEKKKKTDPEIVENVEKEKPEITPPPAAAAKSEAALVKPQEETVKQPATNVAFDELGDVWTEAKQPKKSKKKSRREN